jgi:hypothetical protein
VPRRVIGDLAWGQACLYSGLLLCVAIKPEGLGANSGISYYGVHRETVLPYTIALVASALVTCRGLRAAAASTPSPGRLRGSASSLAALSFGIALTPYSLNTLFDWLHTILGALLFILQLGLALQLLRWTGGDHVTAGLLLAQFAGAVFAAIFVLPKNGFLIQGEVAFQVAFGALLVRTFSLLLPEAVRPDPVSEHSG